MSFEYSAQGLLWKVVKHHGIGLGWQLSGFFTGVVGEN